MNLSNFHPLVAFSFNHLTRGYRRSWPILYAENVIYMEMVITVNISAFILLRDRLHRSFHFSYSHYQLDTGERLAFELLFQVFWTPYLFNSVYVSGVLHGSCYIWIESKCLIKMDFKPDIKIAHQKSDPKFTYFNPNLKWKEIIYAIVNKKPTIISCYGKINMYTLFNI